MFKLLTTILILSSIQAKIVDLRKYQTPVKNQKDRNTCAYFAVTALLEGVISQRFNKKYDISEEFQIYYGKTHFNEYSDKEFGSTQDVAMNFVKQYFFMKEEDFPYQTSLFEPGKRCEDEDPYDPLTPAQCFSGGPLVFDSSHYVKLDGLSFDWITGMWSFGKTRAQLIQKRIDEGRPVVLTLKVYPPGWDNAHVQYTDQINEKCENGQYQCAGHAVLLTGYDTDKEIFMFKNSWGIKWGDSGYGTMSFDYVNKYSDSPVSLYFERMIGGVRE